MGIASPRNESVDRRAKRTRAALRASAIALIAERGLKDVLVRDICTRAGVGRSTFYAHFGDIDALLVAGLDDLHRELRAVAPIGEPLAFVQPLFEHVHGHLHASVRGAASFRSFVNGRGAVQRRFVALVEQLFAEELGRTHQAAVRFLAGSCVHLLDWSMMPTCTIGADEVAAELRRLAQPVLDELRRSRGLTAHARETIGRARVQPPLRARSAACR
jgi:AcrR family transcriptional regulator